MRSMIRKLALLTAAAALVLPAVGAFAQTKTYTLKVASFTP